MSPFLVLCLALCLDYFLGEPKRYHPLVGFGNYAQQIEHSLNQSIDSEQKRLLMGCLAVVLAVFPFFLLARYIAIEPESLFLSLLEAVILYFSIGMQSLKKHANDIYQALQKNDLALARQNVAKVVSRDTQKMDKSDISRAGIESILENGSDAVFAPIFWFLIAGIPGVVCYRIINTLDAMWGYKTPRFKSFGFAAAKLDDILNYIPARLTALSYAMMGNWQAAIKCWKNQAKQWSGINPGVVMAAGGGALGVQLGGGDYYHGEYVARPDLGVGNEPGEADIIAALNLLERVIFLWLGSLVLVYYPLL